MMSILGRLTRCLLAKSARRFPWTVCFLPSPVPLVTRCDDYPGPEVAKTLIVFLPGLGDAPEDFEQHGFIRAVRKTGLLADLVVVDAHYGYYANKSILHLLHEDVFKPAKQRGYDYYWLVGISLGGFGALLYTSHYESDVTGIVAVAPYLGRPSLIDEIAGIVSLQRERPNKLGEDEAVRQVWAWLKKQNLRLSRCPRLYLAYGTGDRFALGHELVRNMLPEKQTFVTAGAHDWHTWQNLWEEIMRSGCLAPIQDGQEKY